MKQIRKIKKLNSTESQILLIACGGNSERMGTDKSQLNYHGLPQYLHLFNISLPHFPEIYFSIQKKQQSLFSGYTNVIIDSEKFAGHGPVSGLLSCHEKFRNRNILYIGCDYPLLSIIDILKLKSGGDQTCAFFHEYYEPLLANYSTESLNKIEIEFYSGKYSLQEFLKRNDAGKILPNSAESIKSIDTDDERKIVIQKIQSLSHNKD